MSALFEEVTNPPEDWRTDPMLVRLTRPNGSSVIVRVPPEHIERVMALASGEFGDKSIETPK